MALVLNLPVEIVDIVNAIADSDEPNAAIDLITGIDNAVADYDFTLAVARRLVALLVKCCEEDGEEFDVTTLIG
ncbi:hypothetical protein [Achromobacter aloeverae]|uniref:Uncharacterized protein n=1 Tax=Achromobacter aloeverae TaxID=1750518 RepID=A0A4Q1HIS8_9BURK|nr:hypothetical protein [Achromobacter aloeverae]RXN87991.1 hypothetical protein C7R54_15555 [Achromobacter aloeverae]